MKLFQWLFLKTNIENLKINILILKLAKRTEAIERDSALYRLSFVHLPNLFMNTLNPESGALTEDSRQNESLEAESAILEVQAMEPSSSTVLNASLPPQNTGNNFANASQGAAKSFYLEGLQQVTVLGICRSIGYTLVFFATVDLLYALIPPKFTDPVWEFQTIGDWFERVPVLVLGLMLVFYGERHFRTRLEHHLLRLLSWLSLVLGLSFLLILPLCVNDAVQINRLNNQQINTQLNEQNDQLDKARSRILSASEAELETLLLAPEQAAKVPNAPRTTKVAKNVALDNLEKVADQTTEKANQARKNLKRNLLKNTARLIAGFFVSSGLLFYLWKKTDWARNLSSYKRAMVVPKTKQQKSFNPGQDLARMTAKKTTLKVKGRKHKAK